MSEDRDCIMCGDKCEEVIPATKENKNVQIKILKDHIVFDFRRLCLECNQEINQNGVRKYTK